MKKLFALAATLAALLPAARAADTDPPSASASASASASTSASASAPAPASEPAAPGDASKPSSDMCFYAHRPTGTANFTVLGPLKQGKQTYGSVRDLLPSLAAQARAQGGDAIVDYDAGQHFGFWPWRLVRPIAHGTAIKWTGPAPDCPASGGKWLASILVDNVAPDKR